MSKIIQFQTLFLRYLCFILTFISGNVQSVIADQDEISPVNTNLITASTAVNFQETVLLGLELFIHDGWKIYAPCDNDNDPAARHPQFVWEHNLNVKNITIKWPTANLIQENDEQIPIYKGRTVIPLTIKVEDLNQPVQLKGRVALIACSDQCVPIEQQISIYLPAGSGSQTRYASELVNVQQQALRENSISHDLPRQSLLWMILIALLGGAILNFMPCVLPVLSLKLKFLVTHQSTLYRLNFVATCVGILTSFLIFAFIAIGLRQSGQLFGWGTHFQQPYFIVFMCVVMVVFACNIWGGSTLTLPNFIRVPVNHFANLKFDQSQVVSEGLLSGIIATLLATPCTAPFLGTAIGYALSQGNLEIIILFTALGIGFSFPYLLALILPPKYLPIPKPGRWMTVISKLLALGLIFTAIWLLWILDQTKGSLVTLAVGISLSLLTIILLFIKPGNRWRHLAWICIVNIFVCTYCIDGNINRVKADDIMAHYWQPFDEHVIDQAVQNNKIVLVDITASWCTTCHLNKITVFNRDGFMKYLSSSQVVAMRADWTTRDPSISRYLAKYHRHGIPFNIVYGPNAPQGIVLPELLNLDDIIQAFNKAGIKDDN